MIMRNILLKLIFGGIGVLMSCPMYAQVDDFSTWTGVKVNYGITSRLKASGNLEFRSKENLKEADRLGITLGLNYKMLSWLRMEGSYEFHYRNVSEGPWKARHRYKVGATGSVSWNEVKFSLRELFQETFFRGEVENRLRSRLKVSYEPENWLVQPYYSTELYQPIGDDAFFSAARIRYRPGVVIAFSKQYALDVFYCRQYEAKGSRNIVGLEFQISF